MSPGGKPPPYRGAGGRGRNPTALGRRFWVALVALVLLAGVIIGVLAVKGHNRSATGKGHANGAGAGGPRSAKTTVTRKHPVPPPGVTATLLAWRLPVPVSRAVVLTGPGTDLVVAGGLTPSGASGNAAFLLSTRTGALHLVAGLASGVYDASGAVLAGRDVVLGGYGPASGAASTGGTGTGASGAGAEAVPMVQIFTAPSGAAVPASAVPMATATAALPQPRAGSKTVTIGTTGYVVGGAAGASADGEVLATTDGRTFRAVAALPVAVEYPAVAALGGYIFVFGGTTVTGRTGAGTAVKAGTPVDDIQRVAPATGQATVVGHLPTTLEGASAATLGGHIYVAGGWTGLTLQGTIWGYEPATATMVVAGHLARPVSFSGLAVIGSTAWLVGGQSAGRPVATVQKFGPVPAQAAGPSTTTGAKLTPVAGGTA